MKKTKLLYVVLMLITVAIGVGHRMMINARNRNAAPEILIDIENLEIEAAAGKQALFEGISLVDKEDGTINDKLLIESISPFDEEGKRTVRYVGADSANHVVSAERVVKYNGYEAPRFSMSEPLSFVTYSDSTILAQIHANCVIDGDLTDSIFIESTKYIDSIKGIYEITFSVENSAGDKQTVPVDMIVANVSRAMPVITLKDYIVYIEKDSVFIPEEYILEINTGTKEAYDPGMLEVEHEIDVSTRGNYIVTYSYENTKGYVGMTFLTVVVR